MGIADFFKGILPDALIKATDRSDNRKLIIKNSMIFFCDTEITDKSVRDALINKLLELSKSETLPFQLLHEKLSEEYVEYEEISIKQKESLKLLGSILLTDDVECIMMARRIIIAHEKNENALATNLKKQIMDNYPNKGTKVFNLISAGYFDEMIIPFIEVYKAQYGEDKYRNEFRRFYSEILKFFPIAIFVGNRNTEEDVIKALEKRFQLKDIPFIKIHAIGDNNIKKVEMIVTRLGISKKYTTQDNRFITPSGLKAQIYEIKFKN